MRRVLNILESATMAHKGVVVVQDVYNCTGKPSPMEVDTIFASLLKDSLNDAFSKIHTMKVD